MVAAWRAAAARTQALAQMLLVRSQILRLPRLLLSRVPLMRNQCGGVPGLAMSQALLVLNQHQLVPRWPALCSV